MALFFVSCVGLAYCNRNAAQRNEDCNVLNVRGYKNYDLKNNRRGGRVTPCKNVRAMAFARCVACAGAFLFMQRDDVSLIGLLSFGVPVFRNVLYCLSIYALPCIVLAVYHTFSSNAILRLLLCANCLLFPD